MKKIEKKTGGLRKNVRDRMRSVTKRVIAIALAGRAPGTEAEERRRKEYAGLLTLTRKILNQTQGVLGETQKITSRSRSGLRRVTKTPETIAGRNQQTK